MRAAPMSVAPKVPNFFIVGAPKAGTSALYAYLDQHPQIFMSPLKEPNYFASEIRPEHFGPQDRERVASEMQSLAAYLRSDMSEKRFGGMVSSWDDYLRLFQNVADEVAVGEATACYLWSQSAPRRIARQIPHARIIVNLRNPVDRAFSQYLQMVALGRTRRPFREQITQSMRRDPEQFGSSWPLLEFGCYHQQLTRYLGEFPRSQVHISLYEELEREPARLLSELFAFLGVDPLHRVDVSARHHVPTVPRLTATAYLLKKARIWPYLRKLAPNPLGPRLRALMVRSRASLVMDASDRAFLADYYRDEIEKLAVLLDRDLSAWLGPVPQSKTHGTRVPLAD
jgi:Sulfotransferase family